MPGPRGQMERSKFLGCNGMYYNELLLSKLRSTKKHVNVFYPNYKFAKLYFAIFYHYNPLLMDTSVYEAGIFRNLQNNYLQ